MIQRNSRLTKLPASASIIIVGFYFERDTMASLSVRKLDDKVYKKLRARAALHGVSMEEEARQIISQVVSVPERISDVFRKRFGANNGIDLEILSQKPTHEPMDF